jgi:chemotaxis methyl-accepting protein methylase
VHPGAYLRSVARTWRRHGTWAACQWGLEALINGIVHFERLYIIELQRNAAITSGSRDPTIKASGSEAGSLPADAANAAFSTRRADDATLEGLQKEGGWGIDETKRALLREGNTCLLSLVDGRIAGYTWVHTQGRPELMPGLRLQLPQGALYNFAGFTHPDFRGAGLQSRRHEAVLAQTDWAHFPSMIGYVKATNFASRRGQTRSGYRNIGMVLQLGWRGRLWTWLSPELRQRGFRHLVEASGASRRGVHRPARPRLWQRPVLSKLLLRAVRSLDSAWVGALSHTLGPWLHRRLLHQARRSDHHTYTCFYRSPMQLAALTGPVLAHLGMDRSVPAHRREHHARPLRVLLYACSNGAEAYTLSAWLAQERPDLDVVIEASDLHPEVVEHARRGRYTWDEVSQHHPVPDRFVSQVFDRDGDRFVVNSRTRSRVRFSCADIISDDLRGRFGEAEVVLAQNVLFHLPPAQARRAFGNIAATVAPGGALFVEGMDQDLRIALTLAHGLTPLEWRIRDIYEESRRHIPARWWQFYYGAEPWGAWRGEPQRRYGSIFLKEPGRPPHQAQALAA